MSVQAPKGFSTRLNREELGELRLLMKMIKQEEFKLSLVKHNTSRVPHGQDWCKQQEAIIDLLQQYKTELVNEYSRARNITGNVVIDLEHGTIGLPVS
jgi:hypothetical protein